MSTTKTMKLNNGKDIPIIGMGTYLSRKEDIMDAIDAGYRHIDGAWFYGNEDEVGKAINAKIAEGKVKREELFIVSKLWNNFHARDKVVPMIRETLQSLNLQYLDLFLIHWPIGFKEYVPKIPEPGPESYSNVDLAETWKGMEECVELGLTKSIGLSNFNPKQINHILKSAKIKPAVNQIEVNPNHTQKEWIQFSKDHNIVITGYSPMGQPYSSGQKAGLATTTLKDPKVAEIAKKYNKSPGQVILNYLASFGITIVPKSSSKERMIENLDIFDFTLEPEDVAYLDSLNKNQTANIGSMNEYADHPEYPFPN